MPQRPSTDPQLPIGIFDSGVGGLSVMREITALLPSESTVYLADSANAPYGDKSGDWLDNRVLEVADYLVERGIKMLVVACNTATSSSVALLRSRLSIPVVAIEPAIKPAVALTQNGHIGVMATSHTIQGERFSALVENFAIGQKVFPLACPGLADLIEAGKTSGSVLQAHLEALLLPLLEQNIDTLVLGCTHYPLIKAEIQQVVGEGVTLIDPAHAVARQVQRQLASCDLLNKDAQVGFREFLSTHQHQQALMPFTQLQPGVDVVVVNI